MTPLTVTLTFITYIPPATVCTTTQVIFKEECGERVCGSGPAGNTNSIFKEREKKKKIKHHLCNSDNKIQGLGKALLNY